MSKREPGVIIVVCGVSGAGKTTIGTKISEVLGIPFFDADDFHPASNIEKMANGVPLNDEDRRPWLETLAGRIPGWEEQGGAVLACSALKETYRATLASRSGNRIRWIVLHADEQQLADRLALRQDHYFDRELLGSQLEALEIPDYGWLVDASSAPEEIVSTILEKVCSE